MSGVDRAIRVSAAVAVLAVAGIAAYVSYWHAYEVIRAHGETGVTARLEPATIDGLVYCSSMVVLYAARHRLRVPPLAGWLLALGIVATLAANVAQGWAHGPVGAVVAAWPAVSLVGSYELLLWLIRSAGEVAVAHRLAIDQVVAESDLVVAETISGMVACSVNVDEEAVAAYRASLELGQPLSERKLAAMFGKTSRRWARNRITEAAAP